MRFVEWQLDFSTPVIEKESLRVILRSLMEFIPSRFKEINYEREQGKFGQWLVINEIKGPMLIL